jgi:hypothetical protein
VALAGVSHPVSVWLAKRTGIFDLQYTIYERLWLSETVGLTHTTIQSLFYFPLRLGNSAVKNRTSMISFAYFAVFARHTSLPGNWSSHFSLANGPEIITIFA